MKAIFVDFDNSTISISSAFKKKAFTPGSTEYKTLNAVRADYPDFSIVVREFKTNTKQDRYRGLTYDYMRWHIETNDAENAEVNLKALNAMIGNSKCHSLGKRYPTIKKWFLETYPEIAEFGMDEEQLAKWREKLAADAESANVTEMPSSDEAQKKADAESANVTEMPSSSDEEKKSA